MIVSWVCWIQIIKPVYKGLVLPECIKFNLSEMLAFDFVTTSTRIGIVCIFFHLTSASVSLGIKKLISIPNVSYVFSENGTTSLYY